MQDMREITELEEENRKLKARLDIYEWKIQTAWM
jgi:hypothetical protein